MKDEACRPSGCRGSKVPPTFGTSVNPISTRGADHAPTSLLAPPDFQTFRRPWITMGSLALLIRLVVNGISSQTWTKGTILFLGGFIQLKFEIRIYSVHCAFSGRSDVLLRLVVKMRQRRFFIPLSCFWKKVCLPITSFVRAKNIFYIHLKSKVS